MKALFTLFNQPFPGYTTPEKQSLVCLVTGLVIFGIIYVTEPFGISQINWSLKLTYALLHGSVACFVAFLFTVIFPFIAITVYDEKRWTVLKETINVMGLLVTIAWANLVILHNLAHVQFTAETFLVSISYTLTLGLFPIAFALLVKQRILQKKTRQESEQWQTLLTHYHNTNQRIPIHEAHTRPVMEKSARSLKIILTGAGIGEVIEIDEDKFLYIASADNYANVHFWMDEGIKSVLIRNTLKNLTYKMIHYPMVVRCHRSYIINLNKVIKISGDAQGLKLHLKGVNEEILVGKAYLEQVKGLLQQIPS